MSSRDHIHSSGVSVLIVVLAYFFTALYLFSHIAELDFATVQWSVEFFAMLFAQHAPLLVALAAPAVYFLLVLYSLLSTQRRLRSPGSIEDRAGMSFGDEVDAEVLRYSAAPASLELVQAGSDSGQQSSANRGASNQVLIDRLKKDLVVAEQQLASARSARHQFLLKMSHELRTPMNGILGMTELLSGTGLNSSQTRYSDSIRRSGESLLGVINDLLDYSRMESGDLYLEKASFNLRDLVEDICDLQGREAQLKGLELICHIGRSMNEHVVGDGNRIRQLLGNLISNAIKFTDTGEVVVRVRQIDADASQASYQLDVIDTGAGISPEAQARIFDSFGRSDFSGDCEQESAGLGLFITHKLVELMGGTVSLRSRLNQGSHFSVTLRLRQTRSDSESLDLSDSLRGVRVLVVDDNETNRTILFQQLRSWGADPEAVDSGAEALRLMRAAQEQGSGFAAAILDLHMPQMDGIVLAREIAQDPAISHVPRMMLTSAVLELDAQELEDLGIEQYISKPARQWQLYSALSSLIPGVLKRQGASGELRQQPNFRALNFTVLLAEDNLINQEVAVNMLENFGCEVEIAVNGQAALEACQSRHFDVVMMDCVMPVLDGMEATRILRQSDGPNADTPVLALTANVSAEGEQRCLQSGMNDYICKPVKQNELYRRLDKWSEEISRNRAARTHSGGLSENTSQPHRAASELSSGSAGEGARCEAAVEPALLINTAAIDNIRKLQRVGQPDLVAQVLNAYLQKSPALLEEITDACADADFDRIREAAHSMKSSSAYVGADFLAEQFKKIEQAAIARNMDDVAPLAENLPLHYEQTVQQLQVCQDEAA